MAAPDTVQLWYVGDVECLMISCCAGAELQVRRRRPRPDHEDIDGEILLRELYPTKSDLYERARELRREHLTCSTVPRTILASRRRPAGVDQK